MEMVQGWFRSAVAAADKPLAVVGWSEAHGEAVLIFTHPGSGSCCQFQTSLAKVETAIT
jgi:hypothetical protein